MIPAISNKIKTSVTKSDKIANKTDLKSSVPVENKELKAVAIESTKFKICIVYFKNFVALL